MAPFYGWGSTASKLQSHYEEAVYLIPLSSQKFLVLILSTLRKAELTLEPHSVFKHGTPGLGIQRLNHRTLFVLFFVFKINLLSAAIYNVIHCFIIMYPPGYHQNGFMATHVLGHMNYACITHELANCITLFGWLVER